MKSSNGTGELANYESNRFNGEIRRFAAFVQQFETEMDAIGGGFLLGYDEFEPTLHGEIAQIVATANRNGVKPIMNNAKNATVYEEFKAKKAKREEVAAKAVSKLINSVSTNISGNFAAVQALPRTSTTNIEKFRKMWAITKQTVVGDEDVTEIAIAQIKSEARAIAMAENDDDDALRKLQQLQRYEGELLGSLGGQEMFTGKEMKSLVKRILLRDRFESIRRIIATQEFVSMTDVIQVFRQQSAILRDFVPANEAKSSSNQVSFAKDTKESAMVSASSSPMVASTTLTTEDCVKLIGELRRQNEQLRDDRSRHQSPDTRRNRSPSPSPYRGGGGRRIWQSDRDYREGRGRWDEGRFDRDRQRDRDERGYDRRQHERRDDGGRDRSDRRRDERQERRRSPSPYRPRDPPPPPPPAFDPPPPPPPSTGAQRTREPPAYAAERERYYSRR